MMPDSASQTLSDKTQTSLNYDTHNHAESCRGHCAMSLDIEFHYDFGPNTIFVTA